MEKKPIDHLMPIEDIAEHIVTNCPCDPDLEERGGQVYWIHHTWTGIKFLFDIEVYLRMRCGICGRQQARNGRHHCNGS